MRGFLYISFCWVIMAACTDPVELENGTPSQLLVVDGMLVAGDTACQIKLSWSGDVDKRVFAEVEGAVVRLQRIDGEAGVFTEISPGSYRLEGNILPAEIGATYLLSITLADGRVYESYPETIPGPVPIDSLTFNKMITEGVNDLGNVINRKFIELEVHGTIPMLIDGPYLRYEVEDVYRVTERLCGPMPKTCYIYPKDILPPIILVNGANYTAGLPFVEQIVQRSINYGFGERYSFSVYQINHTEAAFEYWEKLVQIVSLEGSIFDIAPAPVVGNVYRVDNPEEMVLGYFSGVAIDTAHLFMSRFDVLDFEPVQPLCGIPGFPLNGPFNFACCDCLTLDNSTTERPDFW